MNQTVQLLMRDAGLMQSLSAEDRNAKLEQFLNDSYAMERQVAYVSKLSCCIIDDSKKTVLERVFTIFNICSFSRRLGQQTGNGDILDSLPQ